MSDPSIRPHNAQPAVVWGSAGEAYDRISASIADAIEHCVLRLAPKPSERVLDVATGTGWAARAAAARGAKVVGVDIGAELIEAARALAKKTGLPMELSVGDAEKLAFPDASFDAVVSTFGVMFVRDPESAARELARVCKKGGRLALTTWPPGGAIEGYFKLMKPYMPPPPAPPPPSPFAWGDRARLAALLSSAFDLRFENGTTYLRTADGAEAWDLFSVVYGPLRTLAKNLPPERREALRKEFVAYHERHPTELGQALPREYVVTLGTRR